MIYPDTSALVSYFIPDTHSLSAIAAIDAAGQTLRIADFAVAEFSAVLGGFVRDRALAPVGALTFNGLIDEWAASRSVTATPADLQATIALVRRAELGLRAPDALHLAICRRIGASLLTFDQRQADAAAVLGIRLAA